MSLDAIDVRGKIIPFSAAFGPCFEITINLNVSTQSFSVKFR